jgi:hypothetical protein
MHSEEKQSNTPSTAPATTQTVVVNEGKIKTTQGTVSGTIELGNNIHTNTSPNNTPLLFVLRFSNTSWFNSSVVEWEYEQVHRDAAVPPKELPPPPRYGGTVSPCDDPRPCEISGRTGLKVDTRIGPSNIPQAGLGRFAVQDIPKGTVIRAQTVGSSNLYRYRNKQELLAAFPLPQDLLMLADFAFSTSALPEVVLLDAPPTMVNHATASNGANTSFSFSNEGTSKVVVATRDIGAGEEFLQDYREIAQVDWLETVLGSRNLKTARQLGETLDSSE